jgi:hypothetical protein
MVLVQERLGLLLVSSIVYSSPQLYVYLVASDKLLYGVQPEPSSFSDRQSTEPEIQIASMKLLVTRNCPISHVCSKRGGGGHAVA